MLCLCCIVWFFFGYGFVNIWMQGFERRTWHHQAVIARLIVALHMGIWNKGHLSRAFLLLVQDPSRGFMKQNLRSMEKNPCSNIDLKLISRLGWFYASSPLWCDLKIVRNLRMEKKENARWFHLLGDLHGKFAETTFQRKVVDQQLFAKS